MNNETYPLLFVSRITRLILFTRTHQSVTSDKLGFDPSILLLSRSIVIVKTGTTSFLFGVPFKAPEVKESLFHVFRHYGLHTYKLLWTLYEIDLYVSFTTICHGFLWVVPLNLYTYHQAQRQFIKRLQ